MMRKFSDFLDDPLLCDSEWCADSSSATETQHGAPFTVTLAIEFAIYPDGRVFIQKWFPLGKKKDIIKKKPTQKKLAASESETEVL